MLTKFLALFVTATMLQSCASSPERNQGGAVWPLSEVFERRAELSAHRLTIEAFLLSNENGIVLQRADEGRPRIGVGRDSCPRASEADLVVSNVRHGFGVRRANRHRVLVSGVLVTEQTDVRVGRMIIEYQGRLNDVQLNHVYKDRCR